MEVEQHIEILAQLLGEEWVELVSVMEVVMEKVYAEQLSKVDSMEEEQHIEPLD